jgi:hypothetical protein
MRTAKIPEGNLITRAFVLCRLAVLAVVFLGSISLLTQSAQAQAVAASPSSLSFGVPTGSTTSAPQTVTVSATGTGTVTVSVPANAGPFATSSNTCSTLTAPSSCTFDVTYTPTVAAGTLQSATLTVTTSANSPAVALSGALGAIQLFTPVDVARSYPNPGNFDNTTIPLSCPAPDDPSPTGTLSSSPDGSGNVLVDNYVLVESNTDGGEQTNVCSGAPGGASSSCFTTYYQNAANAGLITGDDPDTLTNSGNSVLAGGEPGGVPPIDVSGFLYGDGSTVNLNVILNDGGGYVTSTTLFLVTNCTPAGGVAPGGSVSGNPVSPSNPSSLVQTFPLDTNPGQGISFGFNFNTPPPSNESSGAPTVTDIGIDQSTFATMVQNSSGGPAQCLHLVGEVDPITQEPLCKAFLFQCPNSTTGDLSGTNCVQAIALYEARFDSVEIAGPSYSYTFTPGTGPSWFEGPDEWVTPSSNGTATVNSPGTVNPCIFPPGTTLTGDLCPQNLLTEFYGAQDSKPGGTGGTNSVFVPAVDMPLPSTNIASGIAANGWNNSSSVNLAFVASPAVYPQPGTTPCTSLTPPPATPAGCAPPANNFIAAPIKSETYGFTPGTATGVAAPDPTFPVPGDTVLANSVACPSTFAPGASPFAKTSSVTLAEGIYLMHFFATDCASTEELLFTPGNIANQNWASFRTREIGVDKTAPTVTCGSPSPAPNSNGWNNTAVTVGCTATDQGYAAGVSGSGFSPLITSVPGDTIQGSPSETFTLTAAVPGSGWGNPVVATTTQTIADLAGNPASIPTYSVKIDTVLPTITAPTLSPTSGSYTVGQSATVKYGCADVGSGIATCTDTFTGSGGAVPACSGATSAETCTLDTSTAGVGTHKVSISATDLAGNSAGPSSISYSVAYAPVTLAIVPLPTIATPGKTVTTLTFVVLAGDITPAKAPVTAYGVNIAVKLQIPTTDLATSPASAAMAGEVTCTAWPCTVTPSSGGSCPATTTVSGKTTTISFSCPIGTLADLFSAKTAAGVKITVPIAAKAPAGTIQTSGGITSASPSSGGLPTFSLPVPIT